MVSPLTVFDDQARAWLELDVAALCNNVEQVRRHSDAGIMAVIKSNAYGHGMEFVASVLEPRVEEFAVATLEEALSLRARFPDKPITLLSGFFAPAQLGPLVEQRIQPVIYNLEQISWLEDAGVRGMTLALKLDSGMGRLGLPAEDFSVALSRLQALDCSIVLMSHFACADDPEHELNERQHRAFRAISGSSGLLRSFANSAAILSRPQDHYELVRPGIMLYGASPLQNVTAAELRLQPVMRLYARVLDIKTLSAGESVGYGARWKAQQACRIGITSIGYGDGYPRVIAEGAELAIVGKRYPLVGRVSMDSLAFMVEGDEEIPIGTPVELWGETIPVDEVAGWANTIAYELCCKITPRVTRIEKK